MVLPKALAFTVVTFGLLAARVASRDRSGVDSDVNDSEPFSEGFYDRPKVISGYLPTAIFLVPVGAHVSVKDFVDPGPVVGSVGHLDLNPGCASGPVDGRRPHRSSLPSSRMSDGKSVWLRFFRSVWK